MKRTLENCSLIQQGRRKGIGEPQQRNGVCLGYQKDKNDDEPCEKCKTCKLNISYEKAKQRKNIFAELLGDESNEILFKL